MKTVAKKRRSPNLPSYFHQMERPREDVHIIDIAVRRRVHQRAAERRLVRLQERVRKQLGDDVDAFVELGSLQNDTRLEREAAYFDLGYEHGLAEGLARARKAARSELVRQLARDVRERTVQAQLPRGQAALALLECLSVLVLSETDSSERAHS
jgi:hypothetical protein